MSFDKKIADIFNINQLPEEKKNLPALPEAPVATNSTEDAIVDSDYNYARKNLRELIEKGMIDLEEIATIAKQSESPRAYDAMTVLLKTVLDANKDLLALAKAKKEIKAAAAPQQDGKTVNNNLIVAPTSKINKLLAQMEEDEMRDIIDVELEND